MNPSEKEPTLSSSTDRSVHAELERQQSEFGTVMGFVCALDISFNHLKQYHVNLLQFKRMAKLITSPEELRHDAATKGVELEFYMGELLGLSANEQIAGPDVGDEVYRNISASYVNAQKLMNKEIKTSHPGPMERNFQAANYLLGELEDEDGMSKLFEPELELITQWAAELSPDSITGQQAIVTGYAFVRHALHKNTEYSYNDFTDSTEHLEVDEPTSTVDNQQTHEDFYAMTDLLDMDVSGKVLSLESCDQAQYELSELLEHHLETFDDIDITTEEGRQEKLLALNDALKQDLDTVSGLKIYDEVVVYGDTPLILKKSPDDEAISSINLDDNNRIRGTVADISVALLPSGELLALFNQRSSSKSGRIYTHEDLVFSIVLTIDPAAVYTTDRTTQPPSSEIIPLSETRTVLIPINYPGLKLRRRA